jgi:hypothetical protein
MAQRIRPRFEKQNKWKVVCGASSDNDAVQFFLVPERLQSRWVESCRRPEPQGTRDTVTFSQQSNSRFVILAESLKRPSASSKPSPTSICTLCEYIIHVVLCPALRFVAKILLETGGLHCRVEDDASRLTDFILYRNHNGSPSCSLLPLLQE